MMMTRDSLMLTFALWTITVLVLVLFGADWLSRNLHHPVGLLLVGWILYGCPTLSCVAVENFEMWKGTRNCNLIQPLQINAATVKRSVRKGAQRTGSNQSLPAPRD